VTDDPDDPEYRYPEPGERFWHWRHEQWVTVQPAPGTTPSSTDESLRILGEVAVLLEDGGKAIVKLHNLEERP
jgi:hypothetical protein